MPEKNYPYKIVKVNADESKIISKCLVGYTRSFIKCGEKGYVMPGQFKKSAEFIYNMEVRSDDIWVVSFPRSGTTLTQELVWLLENDLDFEKAQSSPLHERFPMLETTSQIPELGYELIKANFMNLGNLQGLKDAVRTPSWETIDKSPSPRFIKTHLPLSMLPRSLLKAKVVYVARDPRDVLVSYYYLHKLAGKSLVRATLKDFWNAFRRDLLTWSPIISHVDEAWTQRHHSNLHFMFYEDLNQNKRREIERLCSFLNKKYTEEQLIQLERHLSVDSFKKNKNINFTRSAGFQFIRKGKVGGWRDQYDELMIEQADEFLKERLKYLDLEYPTIDIKQSYCSYL